MENLQAYGALLQVARNNGISLDQVVTEIENMIAASIDTAKKENNRAVLEKWARIPSAGEYPTAVELITYITKQV